MQNTIKTAEVQNLEQDAAQIEAKLQANAATLSRAKNAVHIAIVNAAEDSNGDNMADLRAAKLEVDSLEAVRKELDRRAAYTGRELEKARAVAQREEDERQQRDDLTSYLNRRAQTFETREQIAQTFALLPDFCLELEFLRREAIRLSERAVELGMEDAADLDQIAGDQNTLLWRSRDAIAGDFHYLQHFVGQILGAVTYQNAEANTAHLKVQAIENARVMFASIREQTEQEHEAEAAALKAYQRGERTREATFAFHNERKRIAEQTNAAQIAEIAEKMKPTMPTPAPAPTERPQHASLSLSPRVNKAA